MLRRAGAVFLFSTATLAGYGGQGPTDDPASEQLAPEERATSGTSAGSVTRTEVQRVSTEPQPPLAAVLQEQPGPKGARVALNRVAVTGDVMTVQLSYNGEGCCAYIPLSEVSVLDDATAQQIGVLKDGQGRWLAAPLYSSGKELRVDSSDRAPAIVWFKFPAPPATSRTVSINIPEVGPFDGVPVTR